MEIEDEETDTKFQEPIQHSHYESEGNAYDNGEMMHDNPSISPRMDAYANSNV